MALNWSIEKVADWEALSKDDPERAVTDAIIGLSMTVGMWAITEDNIAEWKKRADILDALIGSTSLHVGGPNGESVPRPLTEEDFRRRIGLYTNAQRWTPVQFFKAALGWYRRELGGL